MLWSGAGIFSRACSSLCGQKHNRESVLQEATALKESLVDKLASLRASQGGHSQSGGIGLPHTLCSVTTGLLQSSLTCCVLLVLSIDEISIQKGRGCVPAKEATPRALA